MPLSLLTDNTKEKVIVGGQLWIALLKITYLRIKNQREVNISDYYRHFKGNWYKIICIARDAATEVTMVVYQALYGDKGVLVRCFEEFFEEAPQNDKNVNRQKYRFMSSRELGISKEEMESIIKELNIQEDTQGITVWRKTDDGSELGLCGDNGQTKKIFKDVYEAIGFLQKKGYKDDEILSFEYRQGNFVVVQCRYIHS